MNPRTLYAAARRRITRESVTYWARTLWAGVLFAVATLALVALVFGIAFGLASTGPTLFFGFVTIAATVAGLFCMPDNGWPGTTRRRAPVWDTVNGVPVVPDGSGPFCWDPELERLYDWDPYGDPYGYQIRPATPPGDDGGRDE